MFLFRVAIKMAFVVGVLGLSPELQAQALKQLFLKNRILNRASSAPLTPDVSPDLIASIDSNQKGGVGLFDKFYLENVKRVQELSSVGYRDYETNVEDTKLIARRMIMMNGTNSLHRTIVGSELRSSYQAILKGFSDLRDFASLSVKKTDSGLSMSKKKNGAKLLELGVQPNGLLRLDPFLKTSETARFRYDTANQRVLFEVKASW